ncbi:hypothetical protein T07_12564, partial [Trichinella nelsoni]
LQEPPTLAEARKLATRIIQVEDGYQEKQQPRAGVAKTEKSEMAEKIDAMIREMSNLAKRVEQLERAEPRPPRTAPGCFRCGSLDHLRRDCPQLRTRTTAYHPQSDGLVERMNRTLLDLLAKASIDHPDDWDAHLDGVLLAYRSSVHHTTGVTPSRVIFGREMRLPVDLVYGLPENAPEGSVGEYTRRLRQDLEQLYETVRGKAGREQRRQ